MKYAEINYQTNQQVGCSFFVKRVGVKSGQGCAVFYCGFCGEEFVDRISRVKLENKISCGCVSLESWSHGMSRTKEYSTWSKMRSRCYNKNSKDYPDYGGRGIKTSEEWSDFSSFFKDMGAAPTKKHSIDRINVNGDYSKDNCRWATANQQARNKRTNLIIEYNGERLCLIDMCEKYNLAYKYTSKRLKNGWSIERIIEARKKQRNGRLSIL